MSDSVGRRQPPVNFGRTPAGDAFSALVVDVLRLAGRLEAAGNEIARPAGQTTARWQVLAAVEHGPAGVPTVARMLALTRQSVQRVADVLVAEGLVRYEDNPAHRRSRLLLLTDEGLSALRTIQREQAVWADAVAAGLDAAELRQTRAALRRVHARLGEPLEPSWSPVPPPGGQ